MEWDLGLRGFNVNEIYFRLMYHADFGRLSVQQYRHCGRVDFIDEHTRELEVSIQLVDNKITTIKTYQLLSVNSDYLLRIKYGQEYYSFIIKNIEPKEYYPESSTSKLLSKETLLKLDSDLSVSLLSPIKLIRDSAEQVCNL